MHRQQNLSYCIPQGILIVQGREKCLVARPFRLGRFGWFCNFFAISWIVVWGVLVCFPPQLPVAEGSMNYTSPVLVGLFLMVSAHFSHTRVLVTDK